ncbi:hypothetical protein AC1031_010711 [Aphanomyces cochlioides]|nr:hypothetical protein AC1031_010711 [Aphanomyces cochlioides]
MYMKFIRRDRTAGFEQVKPMKEAQSPPSRDMELQMQPANAQNNHPQRKQPKGHYVYQHPMRRRTHSSMTNAEPIPSPMDMSIAIEQPPPPPPMPPPPPPIPEEPSFFSPKMEPRIPLLSRVVAHASPDLRVVSPKKNLSLSPDIDLFADIPSDKNSLSRLESQRVLSDVVLDMPKTSEQHKTSELTVVVTSPPLSPPTPPLNPTPRAKLLMDDRNQPAQMQLEVARKAHIPLFLHLPLHPRRDDGGAIPPAAAEAVAEAGVGSSPPAAAFAEPAAKPPVAPAVTAHQVKRPVRTNTFNFRIDFKELTMGELIGQGAFGTVHKATWRGTLVAVKILQVQHLSPDVLEEFETEVHIMSVLRHPNICLLMGACMDPPTRCLVVEYLPKGSLWCVLRQPGVDISLKKQLGFALDTALGMHYLHTFDPPILHRDLKSPNLLVDGSYRLKISDFGLARVKAHHQTMTGNCGTTQWMAPEVLAAEKYTEKADVFSFGVVCWETVTHACPYDGLSQIQAALGVLNHNLRPTIPPDCPPFLKKLMTVCWGPVPEKRPTFAHIIDMLQQQQ